MVVANVQRIRGKMDIVKKSTEEMAEWLKENKFGPKTVQAFLGINGFGPSNDQLGLTTTQ